MRRVLMLLCLWPLGAQAECQSVTVDLKMFPMALQGAGDRVRWAARKAKAPIQFTMAGEAIIVCADDPVALAALADEISRAYGDKAREVERRRTGPPK